MRLDREDMLIFIENNRPIHGKKIYYKDKFFKGRYEIPSVKKSDRLIKKSSLNEPQIEPIIEKAKSNCAKNNFLASLKKAMDS